MIIETDSKRCCLKRPVVNAKYIFDDVHLGVELLGDDEGWKKVRFSDGSIATVRPSRVFPI